MTRYELAEIQEFLQNEVSVVENRLSIRYKCQTQVL
jgi:hypothetical protein